jgi:hemerythrin-like domain-containing protein
VLRVRGTRHGRAALTQAELAALKKEHDELRPVLEQVRSTADRLEALPPDEVQSELAGLNDVLQSKLMPHEDQDDAQIYPGVARLIGGDDPMAAMSRSHREIRHFSRQLQRISSNLPPDGPDVKTRADILRLLHGLDAILRLHFAQEDEIYHSVAEAA